MTHGILKAEGARGPPFVSWRPRSIGSVVPVESRGLQTRSHEVWGRENVDVSGQAESVFALPLLLCSIGPSEDWPMAPTLGRLPSLFSSLIQMLISSRNTLTDTHPEIVLSATWAYFCSVRFICIKLTTVRKEKGPKCSCISFCKEILFNLKRASYLVSSSSSLLINSCYVR